MSGLNAALRGLFNAVLDPIAGLSPWVGLLPLALLTAIVMLLIFKYTSNQEKLAIAKDRMFAGIFEIRLFNDDVVLMAKAFGSALKNSLKYMGLAFYPALLLILPILLFQLGQMEFRYGWQGFDVGDKALLEVEIEAPEGQEAFEPGTAKPAISLDLPAGVRAETAPVWIPTKNRIAWRLAIEEAGRHEITVHVDGGAATKSLDVSSDWIQVSPVRPDRSLADQILYPAEAPVGTESAPIRRITVSYPTREVSFLGWETYWMWPFFLLAIVLGFALAKPLKVTV
jgi:hypothetical protein